VQCLLATSSSQPLPEIIIQMMILVGVVAMGVLLTISIRGKISKKNAAIPPAKQQIAQAKTRLRIVDDQNAISADLHDKARHLSALMDNKSERLEQLLEEADVKIRAMREMLDQTLRSGSAPPGELLDEADRMNLEIQSLQEPEVPPDSTRVERTPTSVETSVQVDPLTRTVYELADAGNDSVAIAQMLDEQIGKVELILALRES
jgi:hypothetical protein